MNELTALLQEATRRITESYFHVMIDGGDPIYRERVYCYELYHQMRCLWPADTDYYLNGEVDKAAHPILRELGAAHVKPDLLVHRPGYMVGNHAIIEVKTSEAAKDGIRKDIESLALFRTRVRYERAIYLVYGHNAERMVDRIGRVADEFAELPQIEVWLHRASDEEAKHSLTIERTVPGKLTPTTHLDR